MNAKWTEYFLLEDASVLFPHRKRFESGFFRLDVERCENIHYRVAAMELDDAGVIVRRADFHWDRVQWGRVNHILRISRGYSFTMGVYN